MKAVNLIPADQRRGAGGTAGRAGGAVYVLVGAMVVLVLMSVLYAVSSSQVSDRQGKLTNVTAQGNVVQSQATALQPYVTFAAIRQTRQQAIATLAAARFDWSAAMDQIARALPTDVTLSAMTGAPVAGSAAAPVVTGPSVALTGCATTHSEVAGVLVDLRRIVGVTSVSLATSQKANATAPGAAAAACPGATFTATVGYGASTTQTTEPGVAASTATSPTAGSTR